MSTNWYAIPGYEGWYWISSHGQIKNSKGHILKQSLAPNGVDMKVELHKLGQREQLTVKQILELLTEEDLR